MRVTAPLLPLLLAACAADSTSTASLDQAVSASGAVHSLAARRFSAGLPDNLALNAAYWDATFVYAFAGTATEVCASDDRVAIVGAWVGLTMVADGYGVDELQRDMVNGAPQSFQLARRREIIDVPTLAHPLGGAARFEYVIDPTTNTVVNSCDNAYPMFFGIERGEGDMCFAQTSVGWVPTGLAPGRYDLVTVFGGVGEVTSTLVILDC